MYDFTICGRSAAARDRGERDMRCRKRLAAFAICALVPLSALCGGKNCLVLQCGSDWCVSGEDVRKVFTSAEFRKELGGGYQLSVYDDMENPTPKVKSANAKIERLRVESRRFPAISCVTDEPHRLFALIENIPYDITPKELAELVLNAVNARKEAEKLFKKGRGKNKDAADALGRGFVLLESQVGEFGWKLLREGKFAWKEQWEHLKEIDADDRYGWRMRFAMGYGFDLVAQATELSKHGEEGEGEKFIAHLATIPTDSLGTVQRQAIEIAKLAYGWAGATQATSADDVSRLRKVLAMGRDTVWGQYAIGRLILSGESVDTSPRTNVVVRAATGPTVSTPFQMAMVEKRIAAVKPGKDGFSEEDKRNIALYAVMRRIGEEGWDALRARPGAARFMSRFFKDRTWMEDFAWSGRCSDWHEAPLALECLFRQDGGKWIDGDGAGRRFATATALEMPTADEQYLADWLDAFRATALAKRLHASALEQGVWRWRYAIRQAHGGRNTDDPPAQQRFLDKFYNVSVKRFGGALGVVPYRLYNCFGHSVHSSEYYEPWVTAGEWPKRRYSYIVGGVCGELSTFASCCSNAHGLPSVPVGQPGHCAFARRQLDGTWLVNNFISPPTGFPALWPRSDHWTFTIASEATFEGERERRLDANRYVELARYAESRGQNPDVISALYRRAVSSWPRHYTAWREYGAWLCRSSRPLEEHRTYAFTALRILDGWRNPLWDLLTQYFDRVAEKGEKELAEALVELAPMLRQSDVRLQDEGDFSKMISLWAKPLENNEELMQETVEAFAAAQYGTRTFFTQTLGWCANFVFADEKRATRFVRSLPKIAEKFARTLSGMERARAIAAARKFTPDLGPFIASAESSGDVAAFRRFAEMQEKFRPTRRTVGFRDHDFSGELLSSEGMLTLSKPSVYDSPNRHPQAIDGSNVKDFTFCVDKGPDQWAKVTLAGPCLLRGIVVVNRHPDEAARRSQLPFDVEISEDDENWQKVSTEEKLRDQYRVAFKFGSPPRARYVRVRRVANASKDQIELRLSKILVYGTKLY